eukprot:11922943-Heterocapsa_arctica.AAC.3
MAEGYSRSWLPRSNAAQCASTHARYGAHDAMSQASARATSTRAGFQDSAVIWSLRRYPCGWRRGLPWCKTTGRSARTTLGLRCRSGSGTLSGSGTVMGTCCAQAAQGFLSLALARCGSVSSAWMRERCALRPHVGQTDQAHQRNQVCMFRSIVVHDSSRSPAAVRAAAIAPSSRALCAVARRCCGEPATQTVPTTLTTWRRVSRKTRQGGRGAASMARQHCVPGSGPEAPRPALKAQTRRIDMKHEASLHML